MVKNLRKIFALVFVLFCFALFLSHLQNVNNSVVNFHRELLENFLLFVSFKFKLKLFGLFAFSVFML